MLKDGNYMQAENEFGRILQIDPNNIYTCVGLGNLKER